MTTAQYREPVLNWDNHCCVKCEESRNLHVHHVIPRKLGGSDELSNLITLCAACHAAIHPNLQGSLARRLIESWAIRISRLFDSRGSISDNSVAIGRALRVLGMRRFREGQFEVVEAALTGESLLAVRPTGSGKSACFQLPAIIKPGLAIVISPLKALMSDQVSGLMESRIPASFVNSDLGNPERELRLDMIEKGMFKLLYLAPERFFVSRPSEIARLRKLRPSFLVIDEAHCIDRWGSDFRPEYGRLGEVKEALGNPPVLAFTATAGSKAQRRILGSLGITDARCFIHGVDRPNITLLRQTVEHDNRHEKIAALLAFAEEKRHRVMIFVPTVKIGKELQENLGRLDLKTEFYHSKMGAANERDFLMQRFLGRVEPTVQRIICTNAFGMGIDIPDVRLVIHWQHPASVEDYLQEFGRAGRDGKRSVAVLFRDPISRLQRMSKTKTFGLLEFMARKTVESSDLAPAEQKIALDTKIETIRDMEKISNTKHCVRTELLNYFQGNSRRQRKSLGFRFLQWRLTDREKVRKSAYCCDTHLSRRDRKLPLPMLCGRILK
jgi:RecQ family ATP-dependent DNA helicase